MAAVVVDASQWAKISVTGADRTRFLNGVTTVNVPALTTGSSAWGAMLNPKGRVLSVIELTNCDDAFVVRCEPTLGEPTLALLQKYAVMDEVEFALTHESGHRVWDGPSSPWTARFIAGPNAQAVDPAAPQAEVIRIGAGMPRYGIDVDDDCFPFETPLAQLLDYEKGCYIGQEPVFRVHAQGNASKALRVIRSEHELTFGAVIAHPSRANCGTIRSTVSSEGTWLALAYIHRSVIAETAGFSVEGKPCSVSEPTSKA